MCCPTIVLSLHHNLALSHSIILIPILTRIQIPSIILTHLCYFVMRLILIRRFVLVNRGCHVVQIAPCDCIIKLNFGTRLHSPLTAQNVAGRRITIQLRGVSEEPHYQRGESERWTEKRQGCLFDSTVCTFRLASLNQLCYSVLRFHT